jgi:hypothetical protein
VIVISNATEWRAHRDLLHRRTPGFTVLYDRHTPQHHRIFVTWDMAVRESREFARVLIPSYGIFSVFLVTLPITAALAVLRQWDMAMIFVAVCMMYVVSYEWLHASYHAPDASWVGRRALVRRLRRHHAAHHDPRLMQKWNFNVTLPLWDWVRGTIAPAGAARFDAPHP